MARYGKTIRGRASLVAVGSATLTAAVDDGLIHLVKGVITVSIGTGLAVASIQETTSGGTSAQVMAGYWSASQTGSYDFDFGPDGLLASGSSNRLALVVEASNASVFAHAVGYTR